MKKSTRYLLIRLLPIAVVLVFSCEEPVYLPKPLGYNRIDLPEPAYQPLPDTFPYKFNFSSYAALSGDTAAYTERYWINFYYDKFDALLQITYKELTGREQRTAVLLNEAFELTMKHSIKAYGIDETLVALPHGQIASLALLEGEVPTPLQFFTSDTTRHFFRGALYFNTATKNDSLAPIINFIKKDILQMLHSFEWKY